MTFEEKHELIILDFLKDKTGYTTLKEIEGKFTEELGGGAFRVLEDLAHRGFVEQVSYTNPEYKFSNPQIAYAITNAGKNKYRSLKRKTNSDRFAKIVWLITLIASVASAIFTILQYCKSDDKAQTTPTPQGQAKEAKPPKQEKTLIPDTIKAQKDSLNDSLAKKKGS